MQIFATKGRRSLTLTHTHTYTHTHHTPTHTHKHIYTHKHIRTHNTHTRILNFTAGGFGIIQISYLHSRLIQIGCGTALRARPGWAEVIYIHTCKL